MIAALPGVKSLLAVGTVVAVPEIARYEVRRELIRIGASAGLRRLDELQIEPAFLPISSVVVDLASELWAHIRRAGMPTAGGEALDGDAILAAQALVAAKSGHEVIIATTNVAHLIRFPGVIAMDWRAVT